MIIGRLVRTGVILLDADQIAGNTTKCVGQQRNVLKNE